MSEQEKEGPNEDTERVQPEVHRRKWPLALVIICLALIAIYFFSHLKPQAGVETARSPRAGSRPGGEKGRYQGISYRAWVGRLA